MIPLSVFKSVKRILTHANCPDGMSSAMVLYDCLPEAEIVFCQYGSAALAALEARSGDLFCDFSPPRDRVEDWLPPNVEGTVVLDHHATAKDVVERFGELGVYSDEPGVSGAVLAYRDVWVPIHDQLCGQDQHPFGNNFVVFKFSLVAGVRDTWQTSSPLWQESCEQAEALRFWHAQHLLSLKPSQWVGAMEIGKVLVDKNRERDVRLLEQSYRFGNVLVVGSTAISDLCELAKKEYPTVKVVVGFGYFSDRGNMKMKVSIRAIAGSGVDVAAIASHFGGGGHKSAAGFVIDAPMSLNPYEFLFYKVFV